MSVWQEEKRSRAQEDGLTLDRPWIANSYQQARRQSIRIYILLDMEMDIPRKFAFYWFDCFGKEVKSDDREERIMGLRVEEKC